MSVDFAALAKTLEELARATWFKVGSGRQLGIPVGETGITDHNLLALRQNHPGLVICKHAIYEEARTGADWEWWIGSEGTWTSLVFQAKLLGGSLRYEGLTKRQESDGLFQADVLIRTCAGRSHKLRGAVWPLYCFYNSWEDGWPATVAPSRFLGQGRIGELPIYGCAVVSARTVREILHDRNFSRRRTTRDTYLAHSIPWSLLLAGPDMDEPSESVDLRSIVTGLYRLWWDDSPLQIGAGADLPESRRHDRSDVAWLESSIIPAAPQYVLDILEGSPRSRRLKPLARRVTVFVQG